MSLYRKLILAVVCVLAISGLSPARLKAWTYGSESFQSTPLFLKQVVVPVVVQADLNLDGKTEALELKNGVAEIRENLDSNSNPLWQSPADWDVKQVEITDLNQDGSAEAALLVWRNFRPWPIDRWIPNPGRIKDFHNAQNQSCHLILIGFSEGHFKELWAGSALVDPLRSFKSADIDGNGLQELVALESNYADAPGSPARALTAWEWNGFGFTLLARVKARFTQMSISTKQDNQPVILTSQ